jgi:hypothetical protein
MPVLSGNKLFRLMAKGKLVSLARAFCLSRGNTAISTASSYILLIVHAHGVVYFSLLLLQGTLLWWLTPH